MFDKGQVFTSNYFISEVLHEKFSDLFGDKNILHIDHDYSKAKGFKGRVVFGNILNGFISNFIGMKLPYKNVMIYSQKINFRKAVYINDTLELKMEVKEFYQSVSTCELKFEFINQLDKKVANGEIKIGLL